MELFNYLLKVSACSALFFAFYLLALRKLTFFKINRFYLLFSVLISFIIPALQFTIEREVEQRASIVQPVAFQDVDLGGASLNVPVVVGTGPIDHEVVPFDWLILLPYLYGSIVACLLVLSAWRLFQLVKHTKAPVKEINGLKLVAKQKGFTNCSFFNYIFIDENSLTQAELTVLLAHEEVHAKQYHSVDKLILMIAKAVLWFNPIIYLYDRAIEEAHEYEADETTSENVGTESYAALLLKLAVSKNSNPLIHNFVKSPIKQRIKMLFNSKSHHMKKLSYLLALPICIGLVWALATEVVYADAKGRVAKQLITENKPFIEKTTIVNIKGEKQEKVTINAPGKPLTVNLGYNKLSGKVDIKLWFYINNKLYSEEEAGKFDAEFISKLSLTNGAGASTFYEIPALNNLKDGYVFWFGDEPKFSEMGARIKHVYKNYDGATFKGKVVDYSYTSSNALPEGLIIKANTGEIFEAIVEVKSAKMAFEDILKGDDISIQIFNAAYVKDSDHPVVKSYKISKNDKVVLDTWPQASTQKMTVNGVKDISVPVLRDGKSTQMIAVKPILISSTSATVDHKTNNTYLKNAVMEINGDKLEAEDVIWNTKNEIVIAQKAILKSKGNLIRSEQILFSLKTGTYQTNNPSLEFEKSPSAVYKLLDKLNYSASDSVKVNKVLNSIFLNGAVKLNIDGFNFNAKLIEVNKKSNLIKAHHATLSNASGLNVKASLIEFDYTTKKYTTSND